MQSLTALLLQFVLKLCSSCAVLGRVLAAAAERLDLQQLSVLSKLVAARSEKSR
jgi:hypothetical protein